MNQPTTERRRERRVRLPWVLEVTFMIREKPYRRTVLDISAGGMFIQSRRSPPDDTEVHLAFVIEGEPVECRARVAYSRPDLGFGCVFLDLDDEERQRIRQLVSRAEALLGPS